MKASVRPFQPIMLDASGRAMGDGRRAGLHLSDVIRWMRVHLGELDADADKKFGPEWAQYGFMFEMWVGQALSAYLSYSDVNLVPPGECELDGILMNPDRLEVIEAEVWETKATWKQSKKLLTADHKDVYVDGLNKFFWHWLVQIMAYSKALGTRKAVLVVNFVNGDYSYRPPFGGPRFYAIDLEFSKAEIDDNWQTVLENAKAMRREGRG